MGDSPRIAVIGGGLGGMTVAALLQQAGYAVSVYEQAASLERVGAGINLGANVMKIMRRIGLSDRMYAVGLVPELSLSREWDTGDILCRWPTEEWAGQFGMRNIIMHRGDLQTALFSGLARGTTQFGHRLRDIKERAGSIELAFTNGATTEADVVIGADGIDSVVREILLGPEDPIYTGFVAYRAIFPTARLGDFRVSADITKWWPNERLPSGEDRHILIYYLDHSRDEIYFVTGSPDPDWERGVSWIPCEMAEIRECYEGFHPEVMRVIDACPKATKWPLFERKPLMLWGRGNIVLLGDACHPMKPHMGQGAAMAMEDAAVLFRCIERVGGQDFATAFRLYETVRHARASMVQSVSHDNTFLREPTDATWVFGYDALEVPLPDEPTRAVAAAAS